VKSAIVLITALPAVALGACRKLEHQSSRLVGAVASKQAVL